MKRTLILLVLVSGLAMSGLGWAATAHAQANCDSLPTPQARIDCYAGGANSNASQYDTSAATQAALQNAGASPAEAQAAAQAQAVAQKSPTDNGGTSDEKYNEIMAKIMSLFAWLVGAAALTLDYAVYYTVINMGNYVHSLTAIGITWRVLRDVGNIMLIFGFLAIGLSIILNTEKLGYGRKMLPMLLVAAVFLNFSLFFAEAIIDTGNLFAAQFYKQINGGVAPSPAFLNDLTIKNEGISNKIMAQLGLTTIYGDAQDPNKGKLILKGQNPWLIGFMGILLFIVTAFVFFSLAFILIARFVALIFLIILAPIGFAGLAVPQLAGRAKQWWDSLFQQTITAPVLLLMLYVALVVITDARFLAGTGNGQSPNWLGSINGGNLTGFGSILLTFLIAMGLLIAVTVMAKSLSAFGAGAVSKFSNSATSKLTSMAMAPARFAGRAAKGTGKWAYHSSVGRGLNWTSKQIKTSTIGQSQLGRIAAQTLDKGGKGFKEAEEKSVKMHQEYVKSIQTAVEDKHSAAAVDLQRARVEQEDRKNIVEAEQKEIVKATKPLFDEVDRLEKIVKENRNSGRIDPAAVAALAEAQRKAAPAIAQRQDAKTRFEAADAAFNAAKAEQEEFDKALKKKKQEVAIGYADSITKSPFADKVGGVLPWLAAGKGGDAAATKILKAALTTKSTKDQINELVKKQQKEEEEAEGKKEEKKDNKGGEESPAKGEH